MFNFSNLCPDVDRVLHRAAGRPERGGLVVGRADVEDHPDLGLPAAQLLGVLEAGQLGHVQRAVGVGGADHQTDYLWGWGGARREKLGGRQQQLQQLQQQWR